MSITKKNSIKITVYKPNHILAAGISIWAEMFTELWQSRGLVWRFALRDINARYRQSFLGIMWAFFLPITTTVIFVWVKGKAILPIPDTAMPYASFVFLGQMVWLLFAQGIVSSANSLVVAGTMLSKINFPRETLVLAAFGQPLFDFLIRIPLLAALFIFNGFTPAATIILLPVLLIPLLLLTFGVGLITALLNGLFRDISNALIVVVNIGMFITPVVYPPPEEWPYSFFINHLNPISPFVNAARDLATTGTLSSPVSYLSSSLLGILLLFVGWRLFHLAEPQLAERT